MSQTGQTCNVINLFHQIPTETQISESNVLLVESVLHREFPADSLQFRRVFKVPDALNTMTCQVQLGNVLVDIVGCNYSLEHTCPWGTNR